jgi:hypothetical protein
MHTHAFVRELYIHALVRVLCNALVLVYTDRL